MTSLEQRILFESIRKRYQDAESVRCLEYTERSIKANPKCGIYKPNLNNLSLVSIGTGRYEVHCADLLHSTQYILIYTTENKKFAPIMNYKKRLTDNSESATDTILDQQLKTLNK